MKQLSIVQAASVHRCRLLGVLQVLGYQADLLDNWYFDHASRMATRAATAAVLADMACQEAGMSQAAL